MFTTNCKHTNDNIFKCDINRKCQGNVHIQRFSPLLDFFLGIVNCCVNVTHGNPLCGDSPLGCGGRRVCEVGRRRTCGGGRLLVGRMYSRVTLHNTGSVSFQALNIL